MTQTWTGSHGINPKLARHCGVRPYATGRISFSYGEKYNRMRDPDGVTRQPKGIPLGLYWPVGKQGAHTVLLCEGEGDTLAAASILCDDEGNPRTFGDTGLDNLLAGVLPVGVPGLGTPTRVVCGELLAAGTKLAYVCMDGDTPGRQASDRYCAALQGLVGIEATPLFLPENKDLSDVLTASQDPTWHLATLIAEHEAQEVAA